MRALSVPSLVLALFGCGSSEAVQPEPQESAGDEQVTQAPESAERGCPEGDGSDPVLAADTPENQRADRAMQAGFGTRDPVAVEAALTSLRSDAGEGSDHPWTAYAEGRLLDRLGRTDEAEAAYRRAIAAHPTFDRAHMELGNIQYGSDRREQALQSWQRAVQSNPTLTLAWYNLGLAHYLGGDFESALFEWRCSLAADAEDWQTRAKVVQALHALGRFDEAVEERAELRRRFEAGQAPERTTSVVIDQFDVGSHHVYVRETLTWDEEMQYVYVFWVTKGDRTVRTIQLETSGVLREMGHYGLMGMNEGDTHAQLGVHFEEEPSYEALRPIARELIAEVEAGTAEVPISSSPSP